MFFYSFLKLFFPTHLYLPLLLSHLLSFSSLSTPLRWLKPQAAVAAVATHLSSLFAVIGFCVCVCVCFHMGLVAVVVVDFGYGNSGGWFW